MFLLNKSLRLAIFQLNYLRAIHSKEKELDIHHVREALVQCGKPKSTMIEFDSSKLTNRLTDVSNYGHRHRTRFDCNGNGLGNQRFRDLPLLWPSPSSDGFLTSCPSALGAGRSGATSPIVPRKFGYLDVCKI